MICPEHWRGYLTFCWGDGTRKKVTLAPIEHLAANLHTLKVRPWWVRLIKRVPGGWP